MDHKELDASVTYAALSEDENRIRERLEVKIREELEDKIAREIEHKMRKEIEAKIREEQRKKMELRLAQDRRRIDQRAKDREMVRGIFKFYECPGGLLEFVFGKYKEDGIEKFALRDGELCSVPLMVARHLNKSGWYPIHEFAKTENGKQDVRIGQRVRRYGFQSLEFMEIEGFENADKSIITVEHMNPRR